MSLYEINLPLSDGKWERRTRVSDYDCWISYHNELIPHNSLGPAVICEDGSTEWRINGNLHRLDGPAVEVSNFFAGYCNEWWIEGRWLHSSYDKTFSDFYLYVIEYVLQCNLAIALIITDVIHKQGY